MRRTRATAVCVDTGKSPAHYGASPQPELEPEPPAYPVSVCGECVAEALEVNGAAIVYCEHNGAGAVWMGDHWIVRTPLCKADFVAWIAEPAWDRANGGISGARL